MLYEISFYNSFLKKQLFIIKNLILALMQQPAKLVTCPGLNDQQLNFIILSGQGLGKGAFGIVKKAFEQTRQTQELAVKIIPYGDQRSKQKINQEVQILKQLPDHPNLVKVIPLKCFSEKNFYIFMEYCNQGTLQDLMRAKLANRQTFSEEEIFEAFYQILSGYSVLWKKKILHQDLKPDNILIKNGVYKITDFGFSIFHEGIKFSKQRRGTFPYMPLEKLTHGNYYASTKSDAFSLGVIFFKMITGRHPFVLTKFQNYKQYIDQLKVAELNIPGYIRGRMSIPMQHLFDVILKMAAKKESERIDFGDIYKFMQEQEIFLDFTHNHSKNNVESSQVQLPENISFRFVQFSKAFAIPFEISRNQQQDYKRLLEDKQIQLQERKKIETIMKIQKYLCSMRLMVYFFDRLNRKLIVEKTKKESKKGKNEDAEIQEQSILALVYLSTKITTQTIEDSRFYRIFTPQEWKVYKKQDPYMLKLIQTDKQYLRNLINDMLMETKQSKIADRHKIIEEAKKPLDVFMRQSVKPKLLSLLKTRNTWIDINDRKTLTTLNFILSALDIIDNFETKKEEWEQLQGFFRQMQEEEINQLLGKVIKGLQTYEINYSLQLGQEEVPEEQKPLVN